jgi:hypothetical protein
MTITNKIFLSAAVALTLASSAHANYVEASIVSDAPTTIAQQLKEIQQWAAENSHRALEAAKIGKDYVKFGYDTMGILEDIKKNLEDTIYDRWFGGETGKYARKAVEQCLPSLPSFEWLFNYSANWDLGCISNILADAILKTQGKQINQAKTDVVGWVFGDEDDDVNVKGTNRKAGEVVNTYYLNADKKPHYTNLGFASMSIQNGAQSSTYDHTSNEKHNETDNSKTQKTNVNKDVNTAAAQTRIDNTKGVTLAPEAKKDLDAFVQDITSGQIPPQEQGKAISDLQRKYPGVDPLLYLSNKQSVITASGKDGDKYILGSSFIIVPSVTNEGQDNIVNYALNVLPENDASRNTARDLVKKSVDGIKKSRKIVEQQNSSASVSGYDPANLTEFMQKYINTATTSLLAYETGEAAMISFENTQKGKVEEAKNAKEGEPKIDDREKIAADMLQTRAIVSQLLILNQAVHSMHESLQTEVAISSKENKEILVEILNKQDITNGILRDLVGELKTLNAIMSKK